jgi:PKD repeat protein
VIFEDNTTQILHDLAIIKSNTGSPTLPYVLVQGSNTVGGHYEIYSGTAEIPIVNFTGYPLDGYNPLDASFTIQNYTSVNATGSKWYFGDGQTADVLGATINHTYQNAGIYTVKLLYFNSTGYDFTIEKPNYVLASIPTGMIVNLDVKNAITGALIQDATVGIKNVTTGVWRNTTAPTGLVYFSTTDPGYLYALSQNQTITLAANKSGYRSAYETFAIPYNNYRARLFLLPDTFVNATGTGTVVVNVIRNKDGLTVSGMSVVLDTGQIGITNGAGAATFLNVTAGARVVRVSDPDGSYQDTESSFTLAEGETKLLVVQVVLVGESPVTTYGTPVPTPTGTYNPSDPSSPGYGNYTATQVNQQGSEGIIQMLSQLIALWPLIVLGVFMKFIKSAFT